jgi:hypothetical protein
MTLTVACVWVKGPVPYGVEYVTKLESMVRRYLDLPVRFTCFTDRPQELAASMAVWAPWDPERSMRQIVPIATLGDDVPANGRGYWAKLQLFNKAHGLRGRILYLDLDSIVVGDLTPIVDCPATFALTEDALIQERAHINEDRYGRRLVRRFNSSVMVWDAGTQDFLFDDFARVHYGIYSTDQDWIGERATEAQAMPLAWFPRISQVRPPWPADAKVILCKKPKNADAVKRWPELAEWWR